MLGQAASVVLLRRTPTNTIQVLMVKRSSKLSFAASMYAFPGGRVDPADATVGDHPLHIAAIRELFEETSVLLSDPHISSTDAQRLHSAVASGQRDFLSLFSPDLRPAVARLHKWKRIITPEAERKRFDTWFFLAAIEDSAEVRVDGGEIIEHMWVTPREALAANSQGKMALLPPQWVILRELQSVVRNSPTISIPTLIHQLQHTAPFASQPHFLHKSSYADATQIGLQDEEEGLVWEGAPTDAVLVIAWPGDHAHTPASHSHQGEPGSLHRIICRLPIGSGYRLVRSTRAQSQL